MSKLRNDIIKLAHDNPELREDLLPLLQQAKVAGNQIDHHTFDSLNEGDRVMVESSEGWSSGKHILEVGRMSYSKKYDVYTKPLYYIDENTNLAMTKGRRVVWKLLKRMSWRGKVYGTPQVSLAQGDMGVAINSFAKMASRVASGTDLLNQRMDRAMSEEQDLIQAHWDAVASDLKELFETGMKNEFQANLRGLRVAVTSEATARATRLHVTMVGEIFSARVPPDSEMNGWDFLKPVLKSMNKVLPSALVSQMGGELVSGDASVKFDDFHLTDLISETKKMKLMPGEQSSFKFKGKMIEL